MKEKAAKKQSFLNRKRAEWKEMKLWNGNELCKVDWIVSILILTVLFFTCVHSDVKLTGNRSFLMYKHFSDFYQASYEQSGGYWANYLPSTFIAYAIWNLPLYLTGHAPEAILTNSFVNLMWYKLLPVIVYFIAAQLIYHTGKEMGCTSLRKRLLEACFHKGFLSHLYMRRSRDRMNRRFMRCTYDHYTNLHVCSFQGTILTESLSVI